jgi:protein-S-isoprenylcysteine O-methyltransferase
VDGIFSGFASLPGYGLGGLAVILLYVLQSELRFGAKARSHRAESSDRMSSVVVSMAAAVSILGWALAIKSNSPRIAALLPQGFREALLPGLPAMAWIGVAIGLCGLAMRLWAVLTLRERYTRTLLIQDGHTVEQHGPYRMVRHPGYLGSLLALNGVALASGNWIVLATSILSTSAAYAYRVKVEDEMLVARFGESYAEYRRKVPAFLPRIG